MGSMNSRSTSSDANGILSLGHKVFDSKFESETLLSILKVLFSGKSDILNSNEKMKLSETSNEPMLYRSSPFNRNGPFKLIFVQKS